MLCVSYYPFLDFYVFRTSSEGTIFKNPSTPLKFSEQVSDVSHFPTALTLSSSFSPLLQPLRSGALLTISPTVTDICSTSHPKEKSKKKVEALKARKQLLMSEMMYARPLQQYCAPNAPLMRLTMQPIVIKI